MTQTVIAQHSHSEQEREHEHEYEYEKNKEQKYTCMMHPEVVTDHPGNCPKCGMKLVPVAENKRPTLNVQRPTSKSEHAMHNTMPHHESSNDKIQPPSHGGHEMHR